MSAPLWTAAAAAAATGGAAYGDWTATGVSIDSRTVQPNDLFIAIAGERFDGHAFAAQALAAGAAAVMLRQRPADLPDDAPILDVGDTMTGLEGLAAAARARSAALIVAVTGSVGKTGTKEALAATLGELGRVHASAGNLNNHIGAPLSLARLPADMDFAVFELGMNRAGEIGPLSRLIRPHLSVITTVTGAHQEFFDSEEGVADAKAEIFEGMAAGSPVLLNRDNRHFQRLRAAAETHDLQVLPFGADPICLYWMETYTPVPKGGWVRARFGDHSLDYRVALEGRHHAFNSVAVLGAVDALGLDPVRAAAGLASLAPLKGRGRTAEVPFSDGAITVIDETYNASPAAVAAALSVLAQRQPCPDGRRIAVLGDMLELGAISAEAHAALAGPVAEHEIDLLFTVGPEMRALEAALPLDKRGGSVEKTAAMIPILRKSLRPGDIVLLKGSLGMGMERILIALTNAAPAETAAP